MSQNESSPLLKRSKNIVTDTEKKNTNIWFTLFHITFIRGLVKWFVRTITSTCELQRILKKWKGAERTFKIGRCLKYSRCKKLQSAITSDGADISEAVKEIVKIKKITAETEIKNLTICLQQIHGYENLFCEIEDIRLEKFTYENNRHKKLLSQVWQSLIPGTALLEGPSKQWTSVGFQGDDPSTDFRGMGLLGLCCLHYFAKNHTKHARNALQHSHHPKYGYSFAIVSINITALLYEFFQNGRLRIHFYNAINGTPTTDDFYYAFSVILNQFDAFWMESKPASVMEFSRIRNEFKLKLVLHMDSVNFHSLHVNFEQG